MRAFVLLGVLFAVLALPPALRAEEDPDAGQRRAAREAVLIEWSKAAKTAGLGLSEPATDFLDLWLDFCRSKHARRTKESMHFKGVPHAEWGGTDDVLLFKAAFVNLELARAGLPKNDAPALLEAIVSDEFSEAVQVEGDDDRWLRLWGVMLVTEVADRRADAWSGEAWTKAQERVREYLLETLGATKLVCDGTVRLGSLASERLIWLLGIRASGFAQAGAMLADVCATLRSSGSENCARAAAAILAGCPGPEAEAFVLAELASGDWERQRTVLSGSGRYATPAVLEKVAALAREADSDERAQMAFVVLQRAAGLARTHRSDAAAALEGLMGELPDDSERKTMAAMALVQSENANPAVVAWLKTLVKRLEKEQAHPGRIAFLERVIERAEAQPGARVAPEDTDPENTGSEDSGG